MPKTLLVMVLFSLEAVAENVFVSSSVRDEVGCPISNAVVTVSTQKRLLFGYGSRPDHFLSVSNVTDQSGTAVLKFDCCTADFSCMASAEGYYSEYVRNGRFSATEDSSLKMRFTSVSTNLNFILRKEIMPIPMYSHGAMLNLKIPGNGDFVGYDLEMSDWVRPYGQGKTTDFEVSFCRAEENDCVRRVGKVRFLRQGSGAYVRKKAKSDGLVSAYHAETNAVFRQDFESLIYVNRRNNSENIVRDIIAEDEYMVLRTRTEVDSNGKIISANYSKIYGPVRIDRVFRFEQSSFNPTANDTNLEFDTGKNLNRKSLNRTRP